jgi:hypothetical protein
MVKTMTKCKCCRNEFKPGRWCFYDLCDDCFKAFDAQKMAGRLRVYHDPSRNPMKVLSLQRMSQKYGYFEDVNEWLKSNDNRCKCKNGRN